MAPSVRTYDRLDQQRLEEVLERLDELVVKPRSGQGGEGVVVGPRASAAQLDAARNEIRQDPEGWIAQETVQLSSRPAVVEGGSRRGTSTWVVE